MFKVCDKVTKLCHGDLYKIRGQIMDNTEIIFIFHIRLNIYKVKLLDDAIKVKVILFDFGPSTTSLKVWCSFMVI